MESGISVCIVALSFLCATANGITDADWNAVNKDGVVSTNGAVESIAYGNGRFFIGGRFTVAGAVAASNVAQWDGTRWSALDSGLNGAVKLLHYGKDGKLYATGDFTASGKSECRHIAVWNGTKWSNLGSGLDKGARFLATDGLGNLYTSGPYTLLGRWDNDNIGVWKTAWDTLPLPKTNLTAMAADDSGRIYLSDRNQVYTLENRAWKAVGYKGGEKIALVTDKGGALYSGTGSRIEKFNRNAWTVSIQNIAGGVRAIAFDDTGKMYFGGRFNSVKTDSACRNVSGLMDSVGVPMGLGLDDTVSTLVAGDSGRVFAKGYFKKSGESELAGLAQWDGIRWGGFGAGMNGNVEAVATGKNGDLYIAGNFTAVGGIAALHIARWDGRKWNALGVGLGAPGTPLDSKLISAIALDKDGILYVGGRFISAGGKPIHGLAKWNGVVWDSLPSSQIPSGDFEAMAFAFDKDGILYAAGRYGKAKINTSLPLMKWDGDSLRLVDSDTAGYTYIERLQALTFDSKGNLFVGGKFTMLRGVSTSGIVRWDGKKWAALDSGFFGGGTGYITEANALTCVNDTIYIGGAFLKAASEPMQHVALWDGSKLKSVGKGVNSWGRVHSILHDGRGRVFVGGNFESASGIRTNNIACWNGSNWSNLGSGTDLGVSAMSLSDSTLFVGGYFFTAGGMVSPYITSVNINGVTTDVNPYPPAKSRPEPPLGYRMIGSKLFVANVFPNDILSIYSLSGRKLLEKKGGSWFDLSRVRDPILILSLQREKLGQGKTTYFATLKKHPERWRN